MKLISFKKLKNEVCKHKCGCNYVEHCLRGIRKEKDVVECSANNCTIWNKLKIQSAGGKDE